MYVCIFCVLIIILQNFQKAFKLKNRFKRIIIFLVEETYILFKLNMIALISIILIYEQLRSC